MPKRLVSSSHPATSPTITTSSTLPSSIPSIPTTFTDALPLPSLLVFDLDYTLWPFWVDTHPSAPLKPASAPAERGSYMRDRHDEHFAFYAGVPAILRAAHDRGIAMGLASRTHAPELAREMLRGLSVPPLDRKSNSTSTTTTDASDEDGSSGGSTTIRAIDLFTHQQIFPGSKTTHFQRIQAATKKAKSEGVVFSDMLFFDDESRNRNVETELGVTFWLVRDGVSAHEVDRGVWEWRRRRGIKKDKDGSREGGGAVGQGRGGRVEL